MNVSVTEVPEEQPSILTRMLKLVASILAIGALFWGVLLFPIAIGGLWEVLTEFDIGSLGIIAGYVVMIGYFALGCRALTWKQRVSIWVFSVLLQGGWFFTFMFTASPRDRNILLFRIFEMWWFLAFVLSIVGLILELVSVFLSRRHKNL